ncbi:hypothetical protein QQM79_19065 [Marinobacteraceae bacterium S3BR75-40.1]
MRLPQFVDIEYLEIENCLIPTGLAWSLDDGRIKYVVLMPDDSWLPEDPDELWVDLDYYAEQGVPALDAIQELAEDAGGSTIFHDALDPDEQLLEKLFETFRQDPPFELAGIAELLKEDAAVLEQRRQDILNEQGLAPESAESTVYSLLLLAREHDAL